MGKADKVILMMILIVSAHMTASAQQSPNDCVLQAALHHNVNETVLRAFATHESFNRPDTVVKNTNNTYDLGLFGINTVHLNDLAKYGIGSAELLNGCINTFVGAWLYRKKIDKYGNTWTAVGAYHSETIDKRDAYAQKIYDLINKEKKQ